MRIYEENDSIFNPFSNGTDRYYTQGLRVDWLKPGRSRDTEFLPGISHADWCSLVCGRGAKDADVNAGFAIGQNMYTPGNIAIAAPQPYDRPWAGLLYVSRVARTSYRERSLNARRQDRVEVSLGVVGPASLAGKTQILWHDLIGEQRPEGWANQLRNEPVVQVRYETALRWPEAEGGNADIIPRVRAHIGNAFTALEAEVTGRIGWNLAGFGAQPIAAPAPPQGLAMSRRRSGLTGTSWLRSGNLFLRGGIRAVAHNIFLDGNTFARNDIRINRTPFVPEFAVGVEVNPIDDVSVTVQFIHRGSEFETWRGREAPAQEFAALSVSWRTGN